MAEQENTAAEKADNAQQSLPAKTGMAKMMPWLITAMAVVACAGAGFVIGRVFGTRGPAQAASAAQVDPGQTNARTPPDQPTSPTWFYDMEPVIANLNEPGVTRYVRVALTLEVGNGLVEKDGQVLFEQKKPLLKHWLTLYLSNQTLDGIRGEKNLRQMQSQIADALNEGFFPNSKPRIVRVLFKEFSIQ